MPTLPPGPRMPRPLQMLGWNVRPGPFLLNAWRRYGDVFSLKIAPGDDWVAVAHPDAVKEVFTGDPDLLRAGEGNAILGPIVGRHSVLLLDGPRHLRQRRLMLPPFHGERMQRYQEIMREATEREIARFPAGEPFPLAPRMQAITLDVIVRAVFGVEDAGDREALKHVLRGMLEWTVEPGRLLLFGVLRPGSLSRLPAFRRAMEPVDRAIAQEIARHRADPDLAERDDILSMLLLARDEDGNALSDQELRDELVTLLLAGHETTATALSWTFERLLRHPQVLDRLRTEVAAGEEAYLDATIKETLRLRPVLPIVVRHLKADMTIAGHDLPEGAYVVPCIYVVHRRPELYPEPHAFRPDRFLERPAGTYTWIPFGGGIRRCLGASFALFEMQVVLETMLRETRLRADGAAERVGRRAITLAPARGAAVVAG